MRILYAALKYDYGQPERGHSFEYYNFFDALCAMDVELLSFDFHSLLQARGQAWMNRRLLEIVRSEQPDLLFTVLFQDEFDPRVLRTISDDTGTATLNWFCDDHWRFDDFSRLWAPCFNWVVTTDHRAPAKYARIGCHRVIASQWACNPRLYRRLDLPLRHDVTFVGQRHGNRHEVLAYLRAAGVAVDAWGRGWEHGRIDQDGMIALFNQSRINLNLANASRPARAFPARLWRAGCRRLARLLPRRAPGKPRLSHDGNQIKGRNFEVPGCGGFLLTGRTDGLERYYDIGREIVCFEDIDDLLDKIAYYLRHEDERSAIARAGYERTLREHTYYHRFGEIFDRIGLPYRASDVTAPRAMAQIVEVC